MPDKARVIIADFIADALEPEREILGELADLTALDAFSEDDLVGKIEDADAIMVYHHLSLTRRTIERLNHCKLIVRCGVGVDNIDHAFARQRNIPVANVPDYGTEDVADSAIGMMLALTRGIHYYNVKLREPRNTPDTPNTEGTASTTDSWHYTLAAPLRRLRGRTFGIVGLGRIGTATALRAKVHGLHVIFYDPYKPNGYEKSLGIERVESLNEFLNRSDIVSLHCPLTDETNRMIDESAMKQMPTGAYLINTSRGAIVDTAVIPAMIASGQLAGAAIDVLHHEPPTEDDVLVKAWRDPSHPAHHRVILNPHAAFYSEEGLLDMRVKGAQACRQALLGEVVRTIVN